MSHISAPWWHHCSITHASSSSSLREATNTITTSPTVDLGDPRWHNVACNICRALLLSWRSYLRTEQQNVRLNYQFADRDHMNWKSDKLAPIFSSVVFQFSVIFLANIYILCEVWRDNVKCVCVCVFLQEFGHHRHTFLPSSSVLIVTSFGTIKMAVFSPRNMRWQWP